MKGSDEETKLNEKIYEEVRKQLEPLFSDFYPTSHQYRTYSQASKQIMRRLNRIDAIMKALKDSLPLVATFPPRFFCIMRANVYLFNVELFGNFYVNLALLLLVGKGHTLHLEPDREHRYVRHATSLEDIESPTLSLSVKLDFLASHGLTFFRKWIDTKLRNKIAHADFTIDSSGNFFFVDAKGRQKKVDIAQKIVSFADYHAVATTAFVKYLYSNAEKP